MPATLRRKFPAAVLIIVFVVYAAAQDDDVIRVDSGMVFLNALVTDLAGRHVTGLRQNEFRIFEDSVEQPVTFFVAEETPFTAVILLDTSGSMEQRVSLARAAAIRFLDGLRASDSAAVFAFDSNVRKIQSFSNSRYIADGVFDLKADGMTVLNDAVVEAAKELATRPEKRRAIVVLSDGMDTKSRASQEKAMRAAANAGAVIYTIDMSAADSPLAQRRQNQAALRSFAQRSGGTFIATPGGVALREAFRNIVDDLGRQYTLGFQPSATGRDGKWHSLELRVTRPGLTIRTRTGYYAEKSK